MKRLLIVLLFMPLLAAIGQPTKEDQERDKQFQERAAAADTLKDYGWFPTAVAGVNLTQASFTDWAAGGENSLAYNVVFAGQALHNAEKTQWLNSLKLTFGQARLGNKSLRKTDDEIYFESLLMYKYSAIVNPYVAFTLRTQFAPGYLYDDVVGTETQISAFFDPAYLTQSAGVAFKLTPILTTRLGVGVREIVTNRFNQFADDPSTADVEKVKAQGGLESVTTLDWPVAENMQFVSRLELFEPFNAMNEVYARWSNLLAAKVNTYITVTLNVDVLHDVNVTRRTQVKEVLALGLSYTLL